MFVNRALSPSVTLASLNVSVHMAGLLTVFEPAKLPPAMPMDPPSTAAPAVVPNTLATVPPAAPAPAIPSVLPPAVIAEPSPAAMAGAARPPAVHKHTLQIGKQAACRAHVCPVDIMLGRHL